MMTAITAAKYTKGTTKSIFVDLTKFNGDLSLKKFRESGVPAVASF
jgi:hypothetical protein